ncbi:MAG: hypothetical protein Q8J88_00940 [Bacteroidales bacterium]|nr:hypothetical protein [Bacteroidales bacterium]
MNFEKKSYGGGRPVFVNPPTLVGGGFELDTSAQSFAIGTVIPAGTLAIVNESTRKVKVLKSARVTAISTEDTKIVTLEHDEYLSNLFAVGDLVHIIPADDPDPLVEVTVTAVNEGVVTLSAAIPSLEVGDIITQIKKVNDEAAFIDTFNAATIAPIKVVNGINGIDVTKDALMFARRVLPVPASLKTNDMLTANPHVRYSNSL